MHTTPARIYPAEPKPGSAFTIQLTCPTRLFDGEKSWAHPRAGAIPLGARGNPGNQSVVVMTLQHVATAGSDRFSGLFQMRTDDGGATWDAPHPVPGFELRPFRDDAQITVCDFTPAWHAASQTLLGTGHTVIYRDGHVIPIRPRATAYAAYDAGHRTWSPWRELAMPDLPRFACCGAGCTQRLDLLNGDILLPVYSKAIDAGVYFSTVVRCRFDGQTLSYIEHGSELTVPAQRGLYEPSIARLGDRFFLTLRNDLGGYVSSSHDGLTYTTPRPWTWDDGSDLGSYNTQQHWITHGRTLYLAYTRRDADNDHVFRHRAPLFVAQVDPDRLRVLRHTERILMPNRGARLGNFAVTDIGPDERWVTDAEWMQPQGIERFGSDGSVWVTRLRWMRAKTDISPTNSTAG